MTKATSLPTSTGWEKTIWRDESAWSSLQGAVRAVVSEARERLVFLGSADGRLNLLNTPYPQVLPTEQHRWPNQGGHRFWLGPQKRWVWPPIADWEYSAAASVRVVGDVLTLDQPRHDKAYPPIVREYVWQGSRLR